MPLYVLDTDILTLFRMGNSEINQRVMASSPNDLAASIISVEEILSGWYTVIRRVTKPPEIEEAYGRLLTAVEMFGKFRLLNFDQSAISKFDQLVAMKLNVKKNDLRIASIASVASAIVVTKNTRDFNRLPGLTIEDWSQPMAPIHHPLPSSPPTPPPAP